MRALVTRPRAAFVLCVLLTASSALAQTSVQRIADPSGLVAGPTAQGSVGDWLMTNDRIAVVIDAVDNPHGFADTGGNIIDAAPLGGEDRFSSMFTFFANRFGRQALYDRAEVVNAGGAGQTAVLRFTGADSIDPDLQLVTDYRLAPGAIHVEVETSFTNTGTEDVLAFQVGDALQWGLTTHFAPGWDNANRNIPGDGHDIGGRTLDVDWVGGDGLGSSYGYTSLSGSMELQNGSTWSDGNVALLDLPASGGTGSFTRLFLVGDGSLASISDEVFALRGTPVGRLTGTVTESGSGVPIEGAIVAITTAQCLGTEGATSYTLARSGADGTWSASVEPGTYRVLVESLGRERGACTSFAVDVGSVEVHDVQLSGQGRLAWTVTDGSAALPAKLSLVTLPLGERRDGPVLGDDHELIGGNAILSPDGSGETVVPPGDYRVVVSRGTEWDAHVEDITITPGLTTRVDAVLQRSVDTTGWVSADLHVHAENSADSGVPFELRARQSACEGLEICVPTDHDFVSDMSAAIAGVGLSDWVQSFPGNEITTLPWGHHNAYPLTVDSAAPRDGALAHAGLSPSEIFSALRSDPKDPIVQVNHPRAGGLGYFDLTALNSVTGRSPHPDWSGDFDAVEVFNGKRLSQVASVRNDWYRRLNDGHRLTGLGNTDTHVVYGQEIGYPRNFLFVGTDDPAAVTETVFRDAVKQSRAVFTNGPFVELWVNDGPIGDLAEAGDGIARVRVRVQGPNWAIPDRVDIVVNGSVRRTLAVPSAPVALKLDTEIELELEADAWIAAEVRGGDCSVDGDNSCLVPDCPGRLDPIVPPLYGTQPVCPYAHTNPVWVDVDGNGVFDPPGNRGLHVEPIADTRPVDAVGVHTRVDEVVTVRGRVTAPSFALDHRSNTIYFQDDSLDPANNLSAGTTTYQNNLISPAVELGDEIEVTGRITQFFGLTELVELSIEVLRRGGPAPDPLELTVDQLRDFAAEERYEAMLVRLRDVTITAGSWPAFGETVNLTITDAASSRDIDIRIDSDTDVDGTAPPAEPFDLIAVVGQFRFSSPYLGFYQLLPRWRTDIIEPGDPIVILHGPAVARVSSCEAEIAWYTTKAGDSIVEYGTDAGLGSQESGDVGVESHRVTLSGLAPDTEYFARVSTGGVASEIFSFRTAPAAEPRLLSGPAVELAGGNFVQLRCETDVPAAAEVHYGLTGEALDRSVTVPGERFVHLLSLDGLAAGTEYDYELVLTTTACGGGELRESGSFTTRPCRGVRAPSWIEAHPGRDSVRVTWEDSAPGGGYVVERTAGSCDGDWATVAELESPGAAEAEWTDPSAPVGEVSCYRVRAVGPDCALPATACSERACGIPVSGFACPAGPTTPLISRVQTGGPEGSCDEFVELFNPTDTPYDLGGHALRYLSAAGGLGSAGVEFSGGTTIPARGYLLAASSGGSWTAEADHALGCGLSATGGHVVLVNGTADLDGCPPSGVGAVVVDRVGWGTASCPEGGVAAPAPSSGESIARGPDDADVGNLDDTNDNGADFQLVGASAPRNSRYVLACRSNGPVPPNEVSSAVSDSPLLVERRPADRLRFEFEALAEATGHNLYVGTIGDWFSHAASADNACDAPAALAPIAGRLELDLASPSGSRYFLVGAFNAEGEGPTGLRGDGLELPPEDATCAP